MNKKTYTVVCVRELSDYPYQYQTDSKNDALREVSLRQTMNYDRISVIYGNKNEGKTIFDNLKVAA
jgi:hypothetical protein